MNKEIYKARQAVARHFAQQSATTFWGTVSDVDEPSRTCTVTIDDQPYADVLLYAIADKKLKGFVFIPKIDSQVLVSRIGSSNELYVAMFSEVDKVLLTAGDKVELTITGDKVELKADKIVFNGGENKGLVKIAQLQKNLDSLKTYTEAIHAALPSAFSAVGAAMQANGASGGAAYTSAMAGKTIVLEKMENEKIKH